VELFATPSYSNGRKPMLEVARYLAEAPTVTNVMMSLILRHRPDLVYVNASRMLPMAALAAWQRSVPLIFHCHNRVAQRGAVRLLGTSLKVGHAFVISCCHYSAEPLRPYLPEQALAVIYNGVPDTRVCQRAARAKCRRIGVIGRIEPEKGQIEFVAAARSIIRTAPECRFVVVGAPLFGGHNYFDRVLNESRGLPIQFLGWQRDVPSVLSSLDVLVVPSASIDSAPRVILEAFAAGVPVVAFPAGGIPEIIHDGYNGFLANGFTPAALAERIKFVLELDPASRQVVVTNARRCWRHRYSLEDFCRKVCDVIARTAAS
jgi:glycosyltransferase involved in cell wall biosynthesis